MLPVIRIFKISSRSPHLPGSGALRPHFLESGLVAQGIHGLPETGVRIGHELPAGGEAHERFLLPTGLIARNEIDGLRFDDEEAAVDPCAVARGLLLEARDQLTLQVQRAVSSGRLDRGDRGKLAVIAMELDERANVDVA